MRSHPPDLLVAPCSRKAAQWAAEHWHYSRSLPPGRVMTFGVWESDRFVGAVVFGRGANSNIGKPYGLVQSEVCELVRVAMTAHATRVSQVVARALSQLHVMSPGLRLVVSYADPAHGHVGTIYQAGNWIYAARTEQTRNFIAPDGRQLHERQVSTKGFKREYGRPRAMWRPDQCQIIDMPGKYRYLMPLDRQMRRRLVKLAQPYPRGRSVDGDAPASRAGDAGSTPADRSSLEEVAL